MRMKVVNYVTEDILQDFKPNLTLLNEIIYANVTVISTVTIKHKQNSFKQPKWKLRRQKEIGEYKGEISTLDEINKGVKT